MPVQPLPVWQSKLADYMKKTKEDQETNPVAHIQAWQDWIDEVSKGIMLSGPYVSSGTAQKTMFAPLVFPKQGAPNTAALVYSNAWFAWYTGITWIPPPPVPPFSVISMVRSSPSGAAISKTKLLADLTKEYAKKSKDPKEDKLAQYFYDATINAGVMITGIAIAGSPPPPLVIPQHKVL